MWRCVCALVVVAGCWSDDPPINGLTADQWAQLRDQFTLAGKGTRPCSTVEGNLDCDALVKLGQQLFWEPAMSSVDGQHPGSIACVTCHDPKKWFIDSRVPNNVSMGATKPTAHNAMTVVNMALKYDARRANKVGFSWLGNFGDAGKVTALAVVKAMGSEPDLATGAVAANPAYAAELAELWPNDQPTFDNLEIAIDAYLRQLVSLDSPFDRWIDGDDSAISDSAKRGFVIFVGKGTCISCHSGPAFSDYWVHDTGVGSADVGLGSADPDFMGAFATQSLRNIARTAPYMHDGSLRSLDEVVEFYRRGGNTDFVGSKDPLIAPLDLTDDDAHDLVEFLKTLDGDAIPAALTTDIRPPSPMPPSCTAPLEQCGTTCVNLVIDPMNCGACGRVCDAVQSCEMGTCISAMCPLPLAPCGQLCVDFANDPMNCGGCGHVCATYCMNGLCG
jgi:cytochrome c peroxidase